MPVVSEKRERDLQDEATCTTRTANDHRSHLAAKEKRSSQDLLKRVHATRLRVLDSEQLGDVWNLKGFSQLLLQSRFGFAIRQWNPLRSVSVT